ncbi:MAG: hypothetical protein ABIT05_10710 [Chitinophagaceae bacterium]
MKKTLFIALLFGMMSAFTTNKDSTEDPGTARELPGYRLRENAFTLTDYNLWVITNADAFDKTFIRENDTVMMPRFEDEFILAAKVETWSNTYKVIVRKIVRKGDELNFYFGVQRGKTNEGNALVATYPKDPSIKKVNFYHDNMLVRTIPIVSVY